MAPVTAVAVPLIPALGFQAPEGDRAEFSGRPSKCLGQFDAL